MTTPPSILRPKVFVVHEPMKKVLDDSDEGFHLERTRDFTQATEYGELVYIFPAGHLVYDKDYLARTAREGLATFTADDFLLMSGDTLAMAQIAIVASQLLSDDARNLKFLIWSGKHKRYFCQELEAWESDESDVVDLT